MSYITIVANPARIQEMSDYYQAHKKDKTPPYAHFQAKKDGVTITAYESGKVLFQGDHAQEEARFWEKDLSLAEKKRKKETRLPEGFEFLSAIGSDEVGTGSYFGPLTVCAAYVDKENMPLLKELGVKDSKHLNDHRIQKISQDIRSFLPYKLLVVQANKYNDVQKKMTKNQMLALLHNQAIHLLLDIIKPTVPEAIIIDQFEREELYKRHTQEAKEKVDQKIYFATQAESLHPAVAAASIIARDQFLIELDHLSERAGMTLLSGAGPQVDQQASQIIRNDELDLEDFAKLHFANTQKAQKLAQKRKNSFSAEV